jgi:hypothetical protein
MQQGLNQYSPFAAMPNAAAVGGPPPTDEARPPVLSVRINVPNFYQFIRTLRSKVFVTFMYSVPRGLCQLTYETFVP